ncbi:unnamed protein product [Didymodactylos carnosus]|uniref:RING-type E3 ubiquitin transferase n=1 Tax=Didymodactylos carnosus TaxID=1234261 RepID=A0A813XC18_9BILA|nr:unnamed protein product [Didymodactylos carnosus]CAF0867786.1 unnamed protein product [Didymodactylos carnosus]CAF3514346.1 unnamed protein product [Didymodactylos carnosus]CAF3655241.1 unnamed protein product [Didymodactylos carnosus]
MTSTKLRYATQLEIIRSEEKDRYLIQQLSQSLEDLHTKLFGLNHFHIYQPHLNRLSKFLYYLTTTLSNRQTIGEEYICLIQYDPHTKKIPAYSRRLLMILLNLFGNKLFEYLLTNLLIHPLANEYFHPRLSSQTLDYIGKFIISFIDRTHKILFYIYGDYYHLSKLFTRIRYLIYSRTNTNDPIYQTLNRTMKLLTLCLIIQHVIETYNSIQQIALSIIQHRRQLNRQIPLETGIVRDNVEQVETSDEVSSVRCPLCYEYPLNTLSIIECGHLFCWQCIHLWLNDNQSCPICKMNTSPSRIVRLVNY